MRRNQGFTITELMITVVIMGVLASIAIPSFTNYIYKARVTEATNFLGVRKRTEASSASTAPWMETTGGPGTLRTFQASTRSCGRPPPSGSSLERSRTGRSASTTPQSRAFRAPVRRATPTSTMTTTGSRLGPRETSMTTTPRSSSRSTPNRPIFITVPLQKAAGSD
ncbi:MAG: prepilin-type N-terminal cleavage/methylation domain-containing protein, partial [Deltaproteobacteria bacterium]|nr:prepilin-type N-terminal cleavage/methylation domain-containing protein [Deltaproteobacteria bacterium]